VTVVLLKEIELTPADIAQVVRTLGPRELADLRRRLRKYGLILDRVERPNEELAQDKNSPANGETMTDFMHMQKQSISYQEWVGEGNDIYDRVFADVQTR